MRIENENIEEYHKNNAIGSGQLRYFMTNPYEYEAMYVTKTHPKLQQYEEKSRAFIMGQAVEDFLTIGMDDFHSIYTTIPFDAPRKPSITQINAKNPSPDTIKAIEWWDHFLDAGKIVLTEDEIEKIQAIGNNFLINEKAFELWKSAEKQATFRKTVKGDVSIHCRFDALLGNHGIDLKTTSKPLDQFAKAVVDYRYDIQEAWYKATYEISTMDRMKDFDFIVCETEFPFAVQVITLPQEVKDNAEYQCAIWMDKLLKAHQSGEFPKRSKELECEFKFWQLRELGVEGK